MIADTRRPLAYLVLAVGVVTAALLYAFHIQQKAGLSAAARTESAAAALTAMLDQETGLRGYLYTGQEEFLQPYSSGQVAYEVVRVEVNQAVGADTTSIRLAAGEDNAARAWQQLAAQSIVARRNGIVTTSAQVLQAESGKQQMDTFRSFNNQLRAQLDQRRDSAVRTIARESTAGVALLASALALFGYLWMRRTSGASLARSEDEVAYRLRQREFSEVIQSVDSEAEAHRLVQRHLQRSLPGVTATVLTRNNSDNRLQPALKLPVGSSLAQALVGAEPRACVAIRLGRAHQDGVGRDELISCQICASVSGSASCQPMLVGGKVIGTVLIEAAHPLAEAELRSVADTVGQAAPVLANLTTIQIAENRASTDALTGLPNRRAMQDTIKRMSAHATRTARPLAAIAFDLDHFKSINDRHGHEIGDAALSAVGECVRAAIRDSDFAARVGGEEFIVLCPDTDRDGARVLAEKLRTLLPTEQVAHLLQPLTASFGIAVLPEHAASPEILLRLADRACYRAKELGRNRVETATDATYPSAFAADQPRPILAVAGGRSDL